MARENINRKIKEEELKASESDTLELNLTTSMEALAIDLEKLQ